MKMENRHFDLADNLSRNDRVLLTHKATGATQTHIIKSVLADAFVVFDEISGIPRKASREVWNFQLIAKGDPNAPLPKFEITFKELAEQERSSLS
jgi:hypothetical protein